MVTFVLVYSQDESNPSKDVLQNVLLVQHPTRTDFKADWEKAKDRAESHMRLRYPVFDQRRLFFCSEFFFCIYDQLIEAGWQLTTLNCTEVSY